MKVMKVLRYGRMFFDNLVHTVVKHKFLNYLIKTSLLDINECSTTKPCQQKCTNTDGSFQCSCNTGYEVNPKDPNKCKGKAKAINNQ